jgi:hypothetical protein
MSESVTFVCCVESGPLEGQTVRMVESLRRWGGRYADSPVWAVTPRLGLPLSRTTQDHFKRLKVEHLRYARRDGTDWNHFLNKPSALLSVDQRCDTEAIGWLDSDLLFSGEPNEFPLGADEDLLACTPDNVGATKGPGDPLEPYWVEVCKALGFDVNDLPWVTTEREGDRVRLYYNSGVFIVRRSTGFAQAYSDACRKLFDAKLASKVTGFFFLDQIILGLCAYQQKLRRRALTHSHNYEMGIAIHQESYREEKLRQAKIIHHHDCLWMPFFPTFVKCLQATHPELAKWVESLGPLQNDAPVPYRALSKVLKKIRSRPEKVYRAACKVV